MAQDYKENYLNLITSQHRDKPRYIQTVAAFLDIAQDIFKSGADMIGVFDLDSAEGKQLDWVGERVGANRVVSMGAEEAYLLTDNDFRNYIRSKILKNRWDGEIESLQDEWVNIFGSHVIIVDNQNMTIDVYLIGIMSQVFMDLIKAHLIVPKPISVGVRIYYFAPDRLFSYGLENELCTGYGGWWRHRGDEPAFWYDTLEDGNKAGYGVGFWSESR